MSATLHPSINRFLSRAGTWSRGTEAILLLVLVYGVVEWVFTDRSETALYVILFAVPFAAGTGLLSIAREGHLDLLFGAGVSRHAIWRQAVQRAIGIPLLAGLLAAAMFQAPRQSTIEIAGRTLAIALFTGGVAFATGLRNPRYAAGVLWIAARLVLLVSGVGVKVIAQLQVARNGGATPAISELFLSALAFPEILLDTSAPAIYSVVLAAIGLAAIAVSRIIVLRTEFTGKRSA